MSKAVVPSQLGEDLAPYHSFLLERTPKESPSEARIWRKDEYPD